MNEILFYKVNDEYGCFSNFSHHPICIGSNVWRTVEHYFQASKFLDYEVKERIRNIESPMKAASEGRNRKYELRSDWESVKDNVMYIGLRAKFLQHSDIQRVLLGTGSSNIVEHTKNDSYWADGGDGSGKNMLGILLMKVREEIREIMYNENIIPPPWIVYPSISPEDMFWRMGGGESFMMEWGRRFDSTDQDVYKRKFPETEQWRGFYSN